MTDPTNDGHVVAWLDAWRTGELGPDRARAVEAHLESCAGCREALSDLEAFARTVEAGYREAESSAEEPDWGASRAAVVARTSGARGRERSWLPRWAPQVALVLVAVLAIGVLVEEGVRGPDDLEEALREAAEEAPAERETRLERERAPTAAAPSEAPQVSGRRANAADAVGDLERDEPAAADEAGALAGAETGRRADDRPAAPPAGPPEEDPDAAGRIAAEAGPGDDREADRAREVEEARAPPADGRDAGRAEPAPVELAQKVLAPPERFRNEARAALAERDTLRARDALEFFADSVEPEDLGVDEQARLEALADSLAAFLASVP